jgi:predicted nucleic acid-binding protein
MKPKLFIDSDVLMDVLAKRQPFYADSAAVLSLAEQELVQAFSTPLVISNIYYILRKLTTKEIAIKGIRKLRTFLNIIPVDLGHVDRAITSNFKDMEDAIQYYASLDAEINFLITRNTAHFKLEIPVYTPHEFLIFFDLHGKGINSKFEALNPKQILNSND